MLRFVMGHVASNASLMDGAEWVSAFTTLAATLLGAGVSVMVTWLIFRNQRSDRHDELFEAALAEVMRASGRYAVAVRRYAVFESGQVPGQVERPNNGEVVSALAVASMIANTDEYRVLKAYSSLNAFADLQAWIPRASNHEAAQAMLMIWRRDLISKDKAEADLEQMAKQARIAVGGDI